MFNQLDVQLLGFLFLLKGVLQVLAHFVLKLLDIEVVLCQLFFMFERKRLKHFDVVIVEERILLGQVQVLHCHFR